MSTVGFALFEQLPDDLQLVIWKIFFAVDDTVKTSSELVYRVAVLSESLLSWNQRAKLNRVSLELQRSSRLSRSVRVDGRRHQVRFTYEEVGVTSYPRLSSPAVANRLLFSFVCGDTSSLKTYLPGDPAKIALLDGYTVLVEIHFVKAGVFPSAQLTLPASHSNKAVFCRREQLLVVDTTRITLYNLIRGCQTVAEYGEEQERPQKQNDDRENQTAPKTRWKAYLQTEDSLQGDERWPVGFNGHLVGQAIVTLYSKDARSVSRLYD